MNLKNIGAAALLVVLIGGGVAGYSTISANIQSARNTSSDVPVYFTPGELPTGATASAVTTNPDAVAGQAAIAATDAANAAAAKAAADAAAAQAAQAAAVKAAAAAATVKAAAIKAPVKAKDVSPVISTLGASGSPVPMATDAAGNQYPDTTQCKSGSASTINGVPTCD